MDKSIFVNTNIEETSDVIIDSENIPQVTLDNLFNNKGDDE